MPLSEAHDLRTGQAPWAESDWSPPAPTPLPDEPIDIAILGSGIMGAVLAERLTNVWPNMALFDRRPPGCGSTAASTAEIMWAMDVPLLELGARLGETEAARRWRRVYGAVRDFAARIDGLGDSGKRVERQTLYLEGNLLDAQRLRKEAALHQDHGLPSEFLTADQVGERFGIAPRAAILSNGGFEIDPVCLCHALIDRAIARGAALCYPADITGLHPVKGGIMLETADGRTCQARHVILATGYERATLFLPPAFKLLSTFAIATPPKVAPRWRENVMIWEAADPYLYVRTNTEGRVIAGGEDIDSSDPAVRDRLLERSAGRIAAKLEALLGSKITIDRKWAAIFGSSPDGLPAIGRSATLPHLWLSAGFGGNGIAFAALAAQLLERAIAGDEDPDAACFDPYRF